MRILITNHTLSQFAGTELYVRDIAVTLAARGFQVCAFSPELGAVADDLRANGIAVTDDLNSVSWTPDVIHGHHHMETAMAMMHFHATPALFVCHGWFPWEEQPLKHPRILKYVAVDEPCRDRLIFENGIEPKNVTAIFNFADMNRFPQRPPISLEPERALVFSNTLDRDACAAVIKVCREAGIDLDFVGKKFDRVVEHDQLRSLLSRSDIVFAIARSAIEALASGCAVVLMDKQGLGPMVTPQNFEQLRAVNFGIRALDCANTAIDETGIKRAIAPYNAGDAAAVTRKIRETANIEVAIDRYVDLYRTIVDEAPVRLSMVTSQDERKAFSDYLESIGSLLYDRHKALHDYKRLLESAAMELDSNRLLIRNILLERMARGLLKQPAMKRIAQRLAPVAKLAARQDAE